jgi:hypothetical protein
MLQIWNFYIVGGRLLIAEKFIMERHDIRSLRVKYLRAIKAYREEGRPVVYTDETYIHSSQTSYARDDRTGAGLGSCFPDVTLSSMLVIAH